MVGLEGVSLVIDGQVSEGFYLCTQVCNTSSQHQLAH